ncbi:MAG: peptidoglycan DD-metalloendopeptidase family protein [Granulosicoccus sp.]
MKLLFKVPSFLLTACLLSSCTSLPSLQASLNALDMTIDSTGYVVRAGETAQSIAFRHRLPQGELARLNPGINMSSLAPGTVLNIRPVQASAIRTVPAAAQAAPPRTGSVPSLSSVPRVSSVPRQPVYSTRERLIAERASSYGTVPGQIAAGTPGYSTESEFRAGRSATGAITSPTRIAQPQVVVPAAVSDQRLLARPEDYSVGLPPMRAGTLTTDGYPVEEIVGNDYQIPSGSQAGVVAGAAGVQLAAAASGQWRWPTNGQVARAFNPSRPNGRAIDIAGVVGQDVVSVADGLVVFAGRDPTNVGKVVIIRHADDFISVYSHSRDLYVSTNDTVKAGDPVASLGPNPDDESMLRFELRKSGVPVNPMQVLPPA